MEQLRIVDHEEWWITWEDGYGDHIAPYLKLHNEADARKSLANCRKVGVIGTYEAQKITVRRTAEKMDW